MSMHKYLKEMGITSQTIERVVGGKTSGQGELKVKMVLTGEGHLKQLRERSI